MKYRAFAVFILCVAICFTGCDHVIVVEGNVKDKNGQPLTGMDVSMHSLRGTQLCLPTTTDELGEFDLDTVGGAAKFTLTASKPGFELQKKS